MPDTLRIQHTNLLLRYDLLHPVLILKAEIVRLREMINVLKWRSQLKDELLENLQKEIDLRDREAAGGEDSMWLE
jgi:hypothetical protein